MTRWRSFSTRERGSLSENKKRLLNELLPRFLFSKDKLKNINSSISLEIGFGDGANLVSLAQNKPAEVFIGAEPYRSGTIKLLSKIESSCLENILVWPQDVNLLLDQVPENKLKRVYILFPDPWPKKRHRKRRLANPDFLQVINSKLKNNGEFYFASDSSDYCNQVQSFLLNLGWRGGVSHPYQEYMPTKYHQKATSDVSFLFYKKET